MRRIFISIIAVLMVFSITGAVSADISDVKKQKDKSAQQKKTIENKQQKKKVDDKAIHDTQVDMSNKSKVNQTKNNLIKSKHDIQMAPVRNLR